jgi:hypothetical protein
MNKDRMIKHLLRSAPTIEPPETLLNKLEADVKLSQNKNSPSYLWRSIWRKTAIIAAVFAILLSLCYGAAKLYNCIFETKIQEWTDTNDITYITKRKISITGDSITNEEEAKKVYEEIIQLIKEGKAEEVSPGVYKGTLSDGTKFGDFSFSNESSVNEKEEK